MSDRNRKVTVRLSEVELEVLNRDVERSGLSTEAFLQSLIKGVTPRERPTPEFHEVLKNLRQINNNMNQVAAKANSMNFIDTAKYWANVSELQKAIGRVVEKAYNS